MSSSPDFPRMRRLIVNGRFLAGPATAVNNVARDLTRAMIVAADAEGWRAELAVPPSLTGAAEAAGFVPRPVGRRGGISWEQLELPALRRDGIVAGFFNTVPLRGRGYVTMLHDAQVFDAPDSYGRATRLWRQLLSRRAAAHGNHLLTVSAYSGTALLRHGLGSEASIGVVPNGLGPVGSLSPDQSVMARLGLRKGRYCVALASLLPHKNIALALEMFRDQRLGDMQLVLVGRANRAAFEAAGHAPGPNVVFAGFVSDAELAALYSDARAVLVPSFEEGFGLPALEAMAHGTAAMVSDRAALPEVVGDAGLILPSQDAGAWAEALLRLEADPDLRARLERDGRARAQAFTWEAAARTAFGHLSNWYPV